MARVTGSHLICKGLQLEGVRNILALAGDHILPGFRCYGGSGFSHYRYSP